jgi:glutathione S-transferase
MYRLNAAGTLWQDDDPNRISLKMLKLVIGNKNYSSWSMRPWLALRANGIPFEEVFIPLYTDDKADKERILSFSRAGKVPTLVDGDVTVWDSLSIIEYLA